MKRINDSVVQVEVIQEKSMQDLEKQVSASLQQVSKSWREVGLSLGEIRNRRLYEPQTFDECLASKPEWKITRRHADRLIKSAHAAQTVLNSKWSDWLPEVPNEAVGRELAKLPEREQAETYRTACESSGGVPTAADVKNAAEEVVDQEEEEEEEPVTSKRKVKSGSSDLAKTSGTSPPKYKIVVNCELIDIEEVSDIIGCFESHSNAKGDKHSLQLDQTETGEFLKQFGETFAEFKGGIAISVKGVAA